MPDYKDVMSVLNKNIKKSPSNKFSEADLQRYIEKGLKSSTLMNDPLWGVLVKELGTSIESANQRMKALQQSILARDVTTESRVILLREYDYAKATKDAYESVVDSCENLVKEGENAKNELILFDEND